MELEDMDLGLDGNGGRNLHSSGSSASGSSKSNSKTSSERSKAYSKGSKGGEGEGERVSSIHFGAMSLRRCPRVFLWQNPAQSHRKRLVGHCRRSLVHPLSYLSFIPVHSHQRCLAVRRQRSLLHPLSYLSFLL
jgi:hypothetical protein